MDPDAGEDHADVEPVEDDLDRPGDTGPPAGAEAVGLGANEQAGPPTEREPYVPP